MKQQLVSDEMYNVELLSVLCAIAGVYVVHSDYKHMISLVKKMNEILSVTMLQVYKSGISVFEAKCYLYFENDKNFALEIIRNTEKNDIFTGIYDIGNGYTDLFDSKINFIIKCKSSEDLKNGINGITKTLTASGHFFGDCKYIQKMKIS
mgnify:CR=1 FL=1